MKRFLTSLLHVGLPAAAALMLVLAASDVSSAQSFTPAPNGYQFTLQGCRNTGQSPLYSNSTLPLLCDTSINDPYTSGNLGKGWNELDLVPFKLTINSNSAATYNVYIGGDLSLGSTNCGTGANGTVACGFDVLTAPQVDVSATGACTLDSAGTQQYLAGVTGGSAYTTMRQLTITQKANSTCVLNWDQRLALGAHLYSGSSLQAYIFESSDYSVGKKTVPLPVNQILPPSVAKTSTATQDEQVTWDIAKSVAPSTVNFGNTCDPATPKSKAVSAKVTWTKHDPTPLGPINVSTIVTITNNAARSLTASISDKTFNAATSPYTLLDTTTVNNVALPASQSVNKTIAIQLTGAYTSLADTATVTFVDNLTQVTIPGSLPASYGPFSVGTGAVTNSTATAYDDMSIQGVLYKYSVDSLLNSIGSVAYGDHNNPGAPYTFATATTSALFWNSGSVSASGSETLKQTVYITGPGTNNTGTLNDQAFLKGSATAEQSTTAQKINLSAHPLVTITVSKTVDTMPTGMTQMFTFHVFDSATPPNEVATPTLTFSSAGTQTVDVKDLEPGSYTVKEDAVLGFTPTPAASVTVTANASSSAACAATATFTNKFAGIKVVKTVKGGTGTEKFSFSINGPTPLTTTLTPPANGSASYGPAAAKTGNYSISETSLPADWTLTDIVCKVGTTVVGTPGPLDGNGIPTSWNFTLNAGQIVTCSFVDETVLTTRTQGFWATHTDLSNTVWNTVVPAGDKALCSTTNLVTAVAGYKTNDLMGGFWSSIAKTSTGASRSSLDQVRMQMLQQYLAAVLNHYKFASGSEAMLTTARAAYCGTNITAIQNQIGVLGSFNNSGDSGVFTPGASATAKSSRYQANITFWDITKH